MNIVRNISKGRSGIGAAIAMITTMGSLAATPMGEPITFGGSPYKTSDPDVKIGSLSVKPATGSLWQNDKSNKNDSSMSQDSGTLNAVSTKENPIGDISMSVNGMKFHGMAPLTYERKDGEREIYQSHQTLYTDDHRHMAKVMLELSHEADRQTGNYTVRNGSVILDSVDQANHQ